MEPISPPVFRTERLELRPLVDSDAEGMYDIRSREETMKHSFRKVPDIDISDTRKWIRSFSTPNLKIAYAVREIHTDAMSVSDKEGKGRIVGSLYVGLERIKRADHLRWELGYTFHPDFWGKGYATEAVQGFVKTWSRIHELVLAPIALSSTTELVAIARKANKASINVLVKSGFVQIGEFVGVYGSECVLFGVVNTSAE
ncbi:GNAT family acetyltransferase [Penicillium tannophilum]|nr:GNAT family acetyltransferase [Penicillium tannophilum]